MLDTAARALAAGLALVAALATSACSARDADQNAPAGAPARTTAAGSPSSTSDGSTKEYPMKIALTVGDERFGAALADSAAARDLAAQLPLTIDMTDHGQVEKTGRLPAPLSLDGQPDAADPDVGDVGYYAPGEDLVLYYGDQSSFPGIVVLGQMDDEAAPRLAEMEGPVTVTIEADDE